MFHSKQCHYSSMTHHSSHDGDFKAQVNARCYDVSLANTPLAFLKFYFPGGDGAPTEYEVRMIMLRMDCV